MTSLWKDLHLRPFDSIMKELGILYRSELVILSAHDERGEDNFLYLVHQVEPITGQEIAVEDLGSASKHFSHSLFDKRGGDLARVSKLIHLSNGLLKIILDPV